MQVWSWTETNWSLIIMLIVGSGVLAWLGDIIGMKFGKRRVSLFGLRPKTAGHLITGLTGIAIAVLTVTILASFSDSVRTALFSLKYVQRQLTETRVGLLKSQEEAGKAISELETSREELEKLRADSEIINLSLNTLKNDKQILENEKNSLLTDVQLLKNEADETSKNLDRMKEGTIAVRVREVLAQDIVPANSSPAAVAEIIENAKQTGAQNIADKFGTTPENVTIKMDEESVKSTLNFAVNSDVRSYIRLSAAQNTAAGQPVELVCNARNSYQIYSAGERVYRRLADTANPNFDAEQFLHAFLRELRYKAIRDGIAADPLTNSIGSLDGQTFFETVEKLRGTKLPAIVNGVAAKDIYTEGPVELQILIEE